MRSAGSKYLLSIFLLGMISWVSPALAADEAGWADRLFREMDAVKSRLTSLEQQQKEILANQTTILEKLDQLRIWVHRK